MKANLPDFILKQINKFKKAGYEIYPVGGAVRDLIMKRVVEDWDFATNATPEQIMKILPKDAFYDNTFGTVMLPHKDVQTPLDFTTYRTEHGYSDARRPDKVSWGKSLEEDLKRRDFTINAIALEQSLEKPSYYKLIDPFGGQKDLETKIIRAVGDPRKRFSKDALRMMRAVRIASELNFQIEKETKKAIQEDANLINKIARERIRDELFKILASPHPYEGILLMKETGLLGEILPELMKGFGVEQKSPGRHHIYDVGTHCLFSLKYCKSPDPLVRFATLIHDIGKPKTYKKLKSGVITFYNHEVVGARLAKRIAKRLRLSNKQANKLWRLVRFHQFTVDERQTNKAIRRFIRNVGLENVEDMLALRVGDRLGGGARETSWRLEEFKKRLVEVQKQPFTVHDLKISGHDVMKELNLKPGPKVGEILESLYKEVVDNQLPNEKKELIKKLKNAAKT